MSRTLSKVERTPVPLGGQHELRVWDMDISNYDDDSGGDGESLTPTDVGLRRFTWVMPIVVGEGSATNSMKGVEAMYDEENDAIRLFYSEGVEAEMREMTSNADEGARVRLVCLGV